jgi:hypothetical protein
MDKNLLTLSTLRIKIETVACDNKNVARILAFGTIAGQPLS